jgi:hypothetical protein
MVIGGGFTQRAEFCISDCFIDNLQKKINQRHPQLGVILMSLKLGGLHEMHAVATWNLGTISAYLKENTTLHHYKDQLVNAV